MPKTKISEFSATPGNNTDIDGINIAEGCAPSGINDAIRELMAQLKDFQAGTAGDSFNGPVGTTTPAAGAFTNLSASGTFALTGDQVQISEGGTGQTTANAAFNALAPSQTSNAGKYLKTDGTNTSWDAIDINTADITGTLPIANGGTGLTALGTGVQTALGQNVTGSGGIVLASSPTLTTPNLGTPSAVTLTNATGLPLSTGVTGTLATTNGGTGLTSFTANGVVYASSSSALTTGSALTFDGSTLNATTASNVPFLGQSSSGSNTSYIYLKNAASSSTYTVAFGSTGDSALFVAGAAEQMRLTSTGLGIGTSSPLVPLHVVTTATGTSMGSNVVGTFRSGAAGRSATVQLSDGTNSNYLSSLSGALGFGSGGTEYMRLDSSGNLGLGVTPSAWFANSRAIDIGTGGAVQGRSNDATTFELATNAYLDSAGTWRYKTTNRAGLLGLSNGTYAFNTAPSGTAGNPISFTQAMTLDAGGNLLVGTTNPSTSGRIVADGADTYYSGTFTQPSSTSYCVAVHNRGTTGDNSFVLFGTEASIAGRGSITYNRAGGLVAYNTTSDYRAKDIIGPVQNPGATIDALKVYEGKMKGATQSRPMLVAHESQAVAPYAVTGEKDAVNEDGTPKFQQMDVSSLVPLLLAEIQSLRARVAQLEAK